GTASAFPPRMEVYFDRGTIVIDSPLDAPPPGFVWDRRVDRWRAPALELAPLTDRLRERGASIVFRSTRPQGFAPERVPPDRRPPLRPYQEEALRAWTAAGRRGLVVLPTGSGKTRLAVHALLAVGAPTIVIVPTRQLLHQLRTAIAEFYPGPIGVYGDSEHDVHAITVMTYESAHRHLDRFGDRFDLLIVDEAHHASSEQVSEAACMTTARFRVGLTGTPPEDDDRRRAAERTIGPVCFAVPLGKLTGSFLADFDVKVIPVWLTAEEQAAYTHHR